MSEFDELLADLEKAVQAIESDPVWENLAHNFIIDMLGASAGLNDVLVLGALRERVAPHGDRGGDEAHQDRISGAVLRASHHAERDPAAGSAVMER